MSAGAHILVVDDDARIRALLKRFLERNGLRITLAQDAAQADRLLAGLAFDLIVLDVMMPGEDGVSFARRRAGPCPILMLTAKGETADRLAGLEAGVDDYLVKPFEPRELLLRIAAILRRAAPPEPEPAPRLLLLGATRLDIARGEASCGAETVRFTASEAALLALLAEAPHEPVPRERLAAALGDGDNEPGERAVDVQMTRLRRKLGDDPRNPRWIRTVRGEGYMLTPE